jgi:hypothetical protein
MLSLFLVYGIKAVQVLLVFGSLWSKFMIVNFPQLLKSFSLSYWNGVETFFYLFAWDDHFFPIVLISLFYDMWLYFWHLDYLSLINNQTITPPVEIQGSEIIPTQPEFETKSSEEAAYTSFKKVTFGWILVGGFYLTLIVVGIGLGLC